MLRIFIFVLFFADCQPQAPPADCCGCDADAAEKKDGAEAKCCGCDKKDGAAAAGGEAGNGAPLGCKAMELQCTSNCASKADAEKTSCEATCTQLASLCTQRRR